MVDALNDATTTIESQVKVFIKELERRCAELHRQSALENSQLLRADTATGNGKANASPVFPKDIRLVLSKNKKSASRTPAQQAAAVASGGSWVCWGSHMSDKARHVILRVDGKPYYGLRKWRASKAHKAQFKTAWGLAMQKANLRNYKGGRGYASGDEFHLELPNSRVRRTSTRAQACLDEYVRLTRKKGKPKNKRFEDKHKRLIEKAERRNR